ncbi:MAG: stage III sporulation protein AB [Syntrophomonadaceae bacterium]
MLTKILGAAFIVSGLGGWGLYGARRLRERARHLHELNMAFGYLEKEITCIFNPLPLALAHTAQFAPEPVAQLFSVSSGLLQGRSGITARDAWLKGVEKLSLVSPLTGEDLMLIKSAADQLGVSDAPGQRKFLSLIQEHLSIAEQTARSKAQVEQQLYAYGGFIAGLVVVLLLI